MSQRLLISLKENITEEDRFYDCIYSEESTLETLLKNWVCYENGIYLGPWRVNIRDKQLFNQFKEDFDELVKFIPELNSLEDCWSVSVDGITVYENQKITETIQHKLLSIKDKINTQE